MTVAELNLKQLALPADQYYPEDCAKKQITIHHTVSGPSVNGDFQSWIADKPKIATAFIIDRDGQIFQVFGSAKWAHHLGVKAEHFKKHNLAENNVAINKASIGIELDSYGGLVKKADGWYTVYGNKVKDQDVFKLPTPYRGFEAFEKYTLKQIKSLEKLLYFLCEKYSISKEFKENMFQFNSHALSGVNGIWSHTSYRPDKSDIYPDPDLISMLKNLKNAKY